MARRLHRRSLGVDLRERIARGLRQEGAVLEPGDLIAGRFRLIRPVGSGGMAEVWWARHELIGRDIALKLTPVRSGAPEAAERFLREARIVGKFQHRNIVAVLDAGELEELGCVFLAMELLHGVSLAERFIPAQPIAPAEIVPVLAEVCRGLTALHEAGVVHRDIKPENIFLAETASGTVPKLVDFGISQSAGDSQITLDGQIVGTPSYMSPEQAIGTKRIDARSDVWSVGVVLYEALLGSAPFNGGSVHDILRRIVHEEPAPLPRSIDERLRAIVSQCLEKDPARRYADAAALGAALDRASCAPHEARTSALPSDTRGDSSEVRFARRAAAPVALVAALAAAGLITFAPSRIARLGRVAAIQPVAARTEPVLRETPVVLDDVARDAEPERMAAPAPNGTARSPARPTTRITTPGF